MKTFQQLSYFIVFSFACLLILSGCKKNSTPAPVPAPPVSVSTLAGNVFSGSTDGTGNSASFNGPTGVVADAQGNIYVADVNNNLIRKITPAGVVTTFAGSGSFGNSNGIGTAAQFSAPIDIAIDQAGNLYVGDLLSKLVRKITPAGVVSTFAGNGVRGEVNGNGTAASFIEPGAIAVDGAGNLFVADIHDIRKITPDGTVSTFAGSLTAGSANGTGTGASFNNITAMTFDSNGNLYAADPGNNQIRKITPAGVVSTFAGSGLVGDVDGKATAASFNKPFGIVYDPKGRLFVTDSNLVREITLAGEVITLAGGGKDTEQDGSAVTDINEDGKAAIFHGPYGLTIDAAGNLYVADSGDNMIRKLVFK